MFSELKEFSLFSGESVATAATYSIAKINACESVNLYGTVNTNSIIL